MKVAKKHLNARNDWLSLSDERGAIEISLLAHRTEICVDVTIDGRRSFHWIKPRALAEALEKLIAAKDAEDAKHK